MSQYFRDTTKVYGVHEYKDVHGFDCIDLTHYVYCETMWRRKLCVTADVGNRGKIPERFHGTALSENVHILGAQMAVMIA